MLSLAGSAGTALLEHALTSRARSDHGQARTTQSRKLTRGTKFPVQMANGKKDLEVLTAKFDGHVKRVNETFEQQDQVNASVADIRTEWYEFPQRLDNNVNDSMVYFVKQQRYLSC